MVGRAGRSKSKSQGNPRKRMRRPEQAFQAGLVKALAMALPSSVFFFAVPNGGFRSKTEAAIFSGQGVVPGMADLVVFHAGRAFCMELKASKGTTSDNQDRAHERITNSGVPVAVVRTLPEALTFLRACQIPLRFKEEF